MALFAISVLLQNETEDGASTTSHSLHWTEAENHDDAIAYAIKGAKKLKPDLMVVDVLCANTLSGEVKRIALNDHKTPEAY